MLRRLSIRGKVLAALSVPVLVLFLMAGALSWQSIQDARTARTVTALLTVFDGSRNVALALVPERRASMAFIQHTEQYAADLTGSQDKVDSEVERLNASLAEIDLSILDPAVQSAVNEMQAFLEEIPTIRGRLATTRTVMSSVYKDYDDVIDAVIAFPGNVGDALSDRKLGLILNAHELVTSTADYYHREQALVSELLISGEYVGALNGEHAGALYDIQLLFPATDIVHASATQAVAQAVAALGLSEKDIFVPKLGASYNGFQGYEFFRNWVYDGDQGNMATIVEADWTAFAQTEIDAYDPLQRSLRSAAVDQATSATGSAERSAVFTIGVSLAAVILSIMAALAIARQIIVPLRRLTEAAGEVRDQLPTLVEQVAIPGQGPDLRLTHIPVTSRDEVGRLAAAFNEVNATTIEVAQEQAALRASISEMFVNVARRDQVLLNRQLSFIDALERSEENPKVLADLFRLDHLATRMRRNSESLLVLAGIETGRRLRESLPVSDMIRTASSEIEHYERVQLDLPVDPQMLGHTALPAAHMLAELLENATAFSDPGTPVNVSTGIDETQVIITILDQGLGMTPDEMADADAKIHTTSAADVLGSQRLGLFVVGRIAARLGTQVVLSRGPGDKGTLVTIRMPLVLFVDTASIPVTAPFQHGKVETFVLPDEAAEVVHDATYAPAPAQTQDVAAGAYGSAENPAEAVNIAALVDGETQLGLPRRRAHGSGPSWDMSAGNAATASAIPLAPSPESLAGAARAGADTESWKPPVVKLSAPLSPHRREGTESGSGLPTRTPTGSQPPLGSGLPTRTPTGSQPPLGSGLPTRTPTGSQPPVPQSSISGATASGLPARQRSGSGGPTAPDAVSTSSATGPSNVEGRTTMFVGFRSRRAELAAASIQDSGVAQPEETGGSGDAVERLAATATGAASFFKRAGAPVEAATAPVATPEEPMVIPSLVDDESFSGVAFSPVEDAEEPWAPQLAYEPLKKRDDTGSAPVQEPPAAGWSAPQEQVTEQSPWVPEPQIEAPAWSATPRGGEAFETPVFELEPVFEPEPVAQYAQPVAQYAEPVAQYPQPVAQYAEPEFAAPYAAPQPVAPYAPAPEPVAPYVVAPEPVAPYVPAPAMAAPEPFQPYPHYADEDHVDFTQLVQGPTRRSLRETKRRRWFGRSRSHEGLIQGPVPTTDLVPISPVFAPIAERAVPAETAFSATESPLRQSAWGASQPGSHAVVEPVPVQEPPAWQSTPAPAAVAPRAAATEEWTPKTSGAVNAYARLDASPVETTLAPSRAPARTWEPGKGWTETEAWPQHETPPAPAPAATPPAPASSLPSRLGPAGTGPRSGQTSFTPQPMFGFDDEMTSMLAQRADIAQQALAELNQLSTYRPQAVSGSGAPALTRRTPGNIPAAPAITLSATPRAARDANQVRSLISSFQSGSSRGRQLVDGGEDASSQTAGDNGHAGSEKGPEVRGKPVATPDTDPNSRDNTW